MEICGQVFDADRCRTLLAQAMQSRSLDALFLTEAEFETERRMKGVNPRAGRNLAEKLDTSVIFDSPVFAQLMDQTLGSRWRVMDYKFVMGLPSERLPDWLRPRIKDQLVANLGPYVKPAYRDVTYFHGIDFHQDIIDFPDRDADFITAYVYLDDVGSNSAPLYLLPDSHAFGATEFPHDLTKLDGGQYTYSDRQGQQSKLDAQLLLGGAGSLAFWHSATLHGTQPLTDDQPRMSLRILVEKNTKRDVDCSLDRLNRTISGPLSLTRTRSDIDADGAAVKRGNTINDLRAEEAKRAEKPAA